MANIQKRILRHKRIRKKVLGTPKRPRLNVYFSGRHITVQMIDDTQGKTLVSVNTTEKDLRGEAKANVANAEKVGKLIAERGLAKNVKCIVFDRGGFKYHGRVKALADAARKAGLQF